MEKLIYRYMNDEVEFDAVVDFLDSLDVNTENKSMLMQCIDGFDIKELYETLFRQFKELLTDSEYRKYEEKFIRTFGCSCV